MAGATYVLDKTYKVTSAAGVTKYRAVVPGTNDGECKLPTAANQFAFGLTQESQASQNENVAVRVYGISRAYANGTVNKGDPVEVASTAGDLRAATLTPGTAAVHHIVGYAESGATNGGIFMVRLAQSPVSVAAS
ncbi:MAG TPA: hypothetical protein VFM21_04100 [Terriglobia bacterium]|nr:hypothetical protein [Terriglobia bacterium]